MKMEIYVTGAATAKALSDFLPIWVQALKDDVPRYGGETAKAAFNEGAKAHVAVPAEEEKPKRGRAGKAKAEEPAAPASPVVVEEAEPAIRATPEDRQPVEEIVEAEVVAETPAEAKVYTRDDVKAALGAYAEKFGMAQAASEGVKLMGAPRISALPEDPAAFAAAVKALNEAVARG